MAKTPKSNRRSKPGMGEAPKKLAGAEPCVLVLPSRTITVTIAGMGQVQVTLPQESFTLPDCATNAECCEACDSIPTGSWGIPWRNAAGEWQCLIGPADGEKRLHADANGPYWANV